MYNITFSLSLSLSLLSFFCLGGALDTLGLEPNLGRQAAE